MRLAHTCCGTDCVPYERASPHRPAPSSQCCNSELYGLIFGDVWFCMHLFFFLTQCQYHAHFSYCKARSHLSCLPPPCRHLADLPAAFFDLPDTVPARGAALTTLNSLREMATKGSLRQGHLILIGFLCSLQTETGSFEGVWSPTQVLCIRLQRSLPLSFGPTVLFTEYGLFPRQGKVGQLQRARESFRNACT